MIKLKKLDEDECGIVYIDELGDELEMAGVIKGEELQHVYYGENVYSDYSGFDTESLTLEESLMAAKIKQEEYLVETIINYTRLLDELRKYKINMKELDNG